MVEDKYSMVTSPLDYSHGTLSTARLPGGATVPFNYHRWIGICIHIYRHSNHVTLLSWLQNLTNYL